MREELVERDEDEEDGAEVVSEEVPTSDSNEGIETVSQQPNPLLKDSQIKCLCTEKVETTDGNSQQDKTP